MTAHKRLISFTLFLSLLACVVSLSNAQTIAVAKESARVKGENTQGLATNLEGTTQEVNAALFKYLKSFGKVKQSEGTMVLMEANINNTLYKNPIYAVTRSKENTIQAWIGFKDSEWSSDEADRINKELEKLLYDFGVKYYKDKIQVQIDESVRALTTVEKQQQRLANEGRSLATKLENNKQQKLQLEKSLEDNKTEYELLLQRIDKNKKDQDSIAVASEQVKKVVESHKEKQRKVN